MPLITQDELATFLLQEDQAHQQLIDSWLLAEDKIWLDSATMLIADLTRKQIKRFNRRKKQRRARCK